MSMSIGDTVCSRPDVQHPDRAGIFLVQRIEESRRSHSCRGDRYDDAERDSFAWWRCRWFSLRDRSLRRCLGRGARSTCCCGRLVRDAFDLVVSVSFPSSSTRTSITSSTTSTSSEGPADAGDADDDEDDDDDFEEEPADDEPDDPDDETRHTNLR